jgi:hypothetical protein
VAEFIIGFLSCLGGDWPTGQEVVAVDSTKAGILPAFVRLTLCWAANLWQIDLPGHTVAIIQQSKLATEAICDLVRSMKEILTERTNLLSYKANRAISAA